MGCYQITLMDMGISYRCSSEKTLLYGMEKLGIAGIPVGCRGGGCGVCKVRVVDGSYRSKKMSRAHIGEKEEKAGFVLACRCSPSSNLNLEVVGSIKKVLAAR